MPFLVMSRAGSPVPRAFDADVIAWRNAVIANGGSVSLSRLIIVDQFVFSEKTAGLWALTDDYWAFWGENAPQALTSLKQRRLAIAVNSPTFTPDRDYTTDGAASYVDTGFVPSTHAVVASANDAAFGVYVRDNLGASSNYAAGCTASSSRSIRLRPRTGASVCSVEVVTGNTPSSHTLTSATASGYLAGMRDGASSANYYVYKNGAALAVNSSPLSFGASLPDVSFFVGGYNSAGVLTSPRASSIGFMAFGRCQTAGQAAARYNNVQAWATSVGAQV